MRSRGAKSIYLLVSTILGFFILVSVLAAQINGNNNVAVKPDSWTAPIDPGLRQIIAAADPDQLIPFLLYLNRQTDDIFRELPESREQRTEVIVNRLRQEASVSQAHIDPILARLKEQELIESWRPLWIANALLVSGKPGAINALAEHDQVVLVRLDETLKLVEPRELLTSDQITPTWGLETIRARHVWHGLGITGQNTTVGIMDTGVDWTHPALFSNYRGNAAGVGEHQGNWFDVIDGRMEPFDPHGHGTHVTGTAVGALGIGVAPGAKWIGVRAIDSDGYATISQLHLGFQWLLAPDGKADLSPDIVNASWGAANALLDFVPDVEALEAAGIVMVFSAGNGGPESGTITAPASYPNVTAVGASDDSDQVTWFSSRGPSPSTAQFKPTVVAPGAFVLSALPNGEYGYLEGTSMATPHVVGAFALLKSAKPSLTTQQLTHIITSTAHAISSNRQPNMTSGWGRIDAYSALGELGLGGILEGTVSENDRPFANIALMLITPSGIELPIRTDNAGAFSAPVSPGLYRIRTKQFGYEDYLSSDIPIVEGKRTLHTIHLVRQPHGRLQGQIIDEESGLAVRGQVLVKSTGLSLEIDQDGRFSTDLPVGAYQVEARAVGYWIIRHTVYITDNTISIVNMQARKSPGVLLVDSGRWYYRSQAVYFAEALTSTDIAFETWTIRNPFNGIPTSEFLGNFDIVYWSAPFDSPSLIGAGGVLYDYLTNGGRLFISGQQIGALEDRFVLDSSWWHSLLGAQYLGPGSSSSPLSGVPGGYFADMELTLNGPDSAGNQTVTSKVKPAPDSFTEAALIDQTGVAIGLSAGRCENFKIIYLGFGLEGVSGQDDRAELVKRSIDFFNSPVIESGLRVTPQESFAYVVPGRTQTMTVGLTNLSEVFTDTFSLSLDGNRWRAQLSDKSISIGPCSQGLVTFSVEAPGNASPDELERFRLAARSDNFPDTAEIVSVTLKIPGHVLLVDDDRWYDQAPVFRAALDESGTHYDFWDTANNQSGKGGPPSELLNEYDIVVWYTGYDWFAPITYEERRNIEAYLENGGSLFLTSQDYLYYHMNESLTSNFFGVLDYRESMAPTAVYGAGGSFLFDELEGPLYLDFGHYQNNSDGIIHQEGAVASLWHNGGMLSGLANSGPGWRTIFWALPFETLPADYHALAMSKILGWLSDFGTSSLVADRRNIRYPYTGSETIAYTIDVRNSDLNEDNFVVITNTIPSQLRVRPSSLTGNASLDRKNNQILWQGYVESGASYEITYLASLVPGLAQGANIENSLEIYYPEQDVTFTRSEDVWIGAPDLTHSSLVVSPSTSLPGQSVGVELVILNRGYATAQFSTSINLAGNVLPITSTIEAASGQVLLQGETIHWIGDIAQGQQLTLKFKADLAPEPIPTRYLVNALLDDGITGLTILDAQFRQEPYRALLSLIQR